MAGCAIEGKWASSVGAVARRKCLAVARNVHPVSCWSLRYSNLGGGYQGLRLWPLPILPLRTLTRVGLLSDGLRFLLFAHQVAKIVAPAPPGST